MKGRYLEVTFRKGKPLAAYLYLPRTTGVKSARTVDYGLGLLVDYTETGEPIGLEITAPGVVSIRQINAVLEEIGLDPLGPEEWSPLHAA